MKSFLSIFLSLFCAILVLGQTEEIDRLKKVIGSSTDKEQIVALSDLSMKYSGIDPRTGIEYGQKALRLSDSLGKTSLKSQIYLALSANYMSLHDVIKIRLYIDSTRMNAMQFNDSLYIAKSYSMMGILQESLGNFDSCLLVFNKALPIYRKLRNKKDIGQILENIGTIYLHRGEWKSAMVYFLEAIENYNQTQDAESKIAYAYLKLGNIYSETKDYKDAEKCFKKAIEISTKINDLTKTGLGLNALGILYKNQGRYQESEEKFQRALDISKNLKNKVLSRILFANMGNLMALQKEYTKALYYHKKSLEIAYEENRPLSIALCQFNTGQTYFYLHDYQRAKSYYEKALPEFVKAKTLSNLVQTYKSLVDVNDSLKDYKNTVYYYKLFLQVKDSLIKNELNSALDSLKVKFRTEQTEKENLLLKNDAEIKDRTIRLQNTIIILGLLLLVFGTLFSVFVIINRRKLKKVNTQLVEMTRFKDSMTSFLVHDLKNSLNTIINIDSWKNSEQQIEIVKHSGKQMLNLVLNLLDVHQYENTTMKLNIREFSIIQTIITACAEVSFLCEKRNIEIKYLSDENYVVKADPEIIERVFINLLTNAIKFSPPGLFIEVLMEPMKTEMLKLSVKDHGEGIAAEELAIIFDKYMQVSARKSGTTRSTGVGLTFCKMAVESHGGQIGVVSTPGNGSTFWFTIPLSSNQETGASLGNVASMNAEKKVIVELSPEEIKKVMPFCLQLKNLTIFQLSNIKDIIKTIDCNESVNLMKWKSQLLKSVSDCNESAYNKLINIVLQDEKL